MDVTSSGSSTSKEDQRIASKHDFTLPTAAILCIAIGVYLILMVIALLVRWYIKTHNLFDTSCCGKDGKCNLCECGCANCSQNTCSMFDASKWKTLLCCSSGTGCCNTCDCFSSRCGDCGCLPDCDGCCQCVQWKWNLCCCNAEDLLCQCDKCDCACTCQLPECQAINCCCFEIRIKT